MPRDNEDDIATEIADRVGCFLAEMQQETGWPAGLILAVAHGHVVALVAQHLGPNGAAYICEHAAARMQGFSSIADMALAALPAAGRA